ncbi:hypothetical protein GUITHDRAFT_99389 [Guillardia theta CCMP2712]|uniref:histone acetyltransferase n=1 Tax=Guillardia theta (strain CCMP2712) TaxID=905079 RepID=L1K1L9_GUITC|nr:hypothetical protein GUITHDRAFT_99389 [Guillardia theta CCMP2712]EKX54736.1 hypothetical protein GUITHDRAFT_99389 [Guillardia theta CCMP2712]|eukprot:XP_005841716.1 hypothetical protein GUITHDRAFT_99389 [Guillardia theta CCMP2712]
MQVPAENVKLCDKEKNKRARFAEKVEESVTIEREEAEDVDDDGESEEEDVPYSCWANEVTKIKMIVGDDEGSAIEFNPLFTHQVFFNEQPGAEERIHEELIIGYHEPKVVVNYAANTLSSSVDFKHDGPVDMKQLRQFGLNRTNVLDSVESRMPHDLKDNNIDKVEKDAKAEFTPYGSEIFNEKLSDTEEVSILHFIADKDEVVPYVKGLQSLAMWCIETAGCIEVPDERWNIFTLYKKVTKNGSTKFILIGFLTAYKYWVYDRETQKLDKYRMRISQVVVLPPFHRQGYGSKLLNAFYSFARNDDSILDVSVEDPSEDFQALRDVTDAKTLKEADCLHKLALPNPPIHEMVRRFKICKQQMKRLATIAKFVEIKECDPLTDPEKKDTDSLKLRLKVKSSLYKQCKCLAKGKIFIIEPEEEEEDEDELHRMKAQTKFCQIVESISKSDVQEALELSSHKIWSNGGDPYQRKKQLKQMFASLFKQHATVARKILSC